MAAQRLGFVRTVRLISLTFSPRPPARFLGEHHTKPRRIGPRPPTAGYGTKNYPYSPHTHRKRKLGQFFDDRAA